MVAGGGAPVHSAYTHIHTLHNIIYMYGCNVYWWGTNATTCCITTCPPARPAFPQTRDVTVEEHVRRNTHTYTHARTQIYKHTRSHTFTHIRFQKHTHTPTYKRTHAGARAHMHIHAHDGSLARGAVIYYATVRRARVPSSPSPSSPSCGRVEKPRAPSRQLLIRARERECNALVDDDDDDDDCIKLHSAS